MNCGQSVWENYCNAHKEFLITWQMIMMGEKRTHNCMCSVYSTIDFLFSDFKALWEHLSVCSLPLGSSRSGGEVLLQVWGCRAPPGCGYTPFVWPLPFGLIFLYVYLFCSFDFPSSWFCFFCCVQAHPGARPLTLNWTPSSLLAAPPFSGVQCKAVVFSSWQLWGVP